MVTTRQQFKRKRSRSLVSPSPSAKRLQTQTKVLDPRTGQYLTRIFTDFAEFQTTLDTHMNRTNVSKNRSQKVRDVIHDQCQSDISKNFITDTANTRVNNKFWVLATKPDGGGLAGFASATLYQDAISDGTPTVYLDLVCSNSGRGTSLVKTVMIVGMAAGAKLMRLSALPKVVGYYHKNFGFTRVPNACMSMQSAYPRVRNSVNVHPNFGPLYMHPNTAGNYNGENYGFVMSKCLPRAHWRLRQRFQNLGLTFGARWKNQNGRSPQKIVGENKAVLTNANLQNMSKNLFNAKNIQRRLFPTQTDENMRYWWNTGMKRYQKKR